MENFKLNDDINNIENFIKSSYIQQLELVFEQEKQKLKLYTDYILNSIPLNIRKLKIKDIVENNGENLILTDEEKNEIIGKLNDIINMNLLENSDINKAVNLTTESISSLEINNNDNINKNFRKTKVKVLPISKTCYTIIKDREENDIEDENIDNNSLSDITMIRDVIDSI